MAAPATSRARGTRRAAPPRFGRSLCPVCERPVTAGQTWMLDRQGRKVHYYCARENPAGPTFAQAMAMARAAGASIGDTSGFEPWLVKAKLAGRGPRVLAHLRTEFVRGVETAQVESGERSFDAYKGVRIYRSGGGWSTDLDRETIHDSLSDARRFVDAQRQNPQLWPTQYAPLLDWSEIEGRYVAAEDLGWFLNRFVYVVVDTSTGEPVRERGDEGKVIRSSGPLKAKALANKLNRMDRKAIRSLENPSTPWWKRRTA